MLYNYKCKLYYKHKITLALIPLINIQFLTLISSTSYIGATSTIYYHTTHFVIHNASSMEDVLSLLLYVINTHLCA